MVRRVLVLAALLAAVGCSEGSSPATPEAAVPDSTIQDITTPETPAPMRDRPTEVEMVAAMEAHYSVVILAHDALLQGNLETFKSQLALVPDQALPPSAPESWLPFHESLQATASEGASVSDLDTAASTLAQVVLACGTCHAALGSGPIYPAPAPDDGDNLLEAAMLDHQWATERLWEGVTGPWDSAWERGADSLVALRIFGDVGAELVLTDELRRREQELREIGEAAKTTQTLDERAALYGRLLATCGECHQLSGVTFEGPN